MTALKGRTMSVAEAAELLLDADDYMPTLARLAAVKAHLQHSSKVQPVVVAEAWREALRALAADTTPAPDPKPGQYVCDRCKKLAWGGDHVCAGVPAPEPSERDKLVRAAALRQALQKIKDEASGNPEGAAGDEALRRAHMAIEALISEDDLTPSPSEYALCQCCGREVKADAWLPDDLYAQVSGDGVNGMFCAACLVEKACDTFGWPSVRLSNAHEATYTQADLDAATALIGIVEGINNLDHGTWRDEHGTRLKDTPEWVRFYNAIRAKGDA
ncbi:hypothetical protein A8B82_04415 [Sulfitobacter sp. EhC04]|uniref:hypothetical protein n=1 Tax=Sulfitobacter sp. EhC04 TaxID=1849168 RepID=UPI0007F3864C|nr:hypothetical protein [Sulfitobacter sp. EhC04]OAN71531.1 hypothetical protein A8B82_04415 [Sulfitobacter sp. EhC04]